jgi:hypothetical protein
VSPSLSRSPTRKTMAVFPVGHVEGTDCLSVHLPNPTLLLPRSLVLAAVLVVLPGARVALAPSHRDAGRRLAAVTTTWILSGRGNVAAGHLMCSRAEGQVCAAAAEMASCAIAGLRMSECAPEKGLFSTLLMTAAASTRKKELAEKL